MKRLLTFVFFLISIAINAQIVNIPDTNFKDILVNQERANLQDGYVYGESYTVNSVVDTNGDGEIQVSEAESVHGIAFYAGNISSLEGIEYFTNLEYLSFRDNQVSSIDISNNTNLKYLNFSRNDFTELDFSANLLLEYIDVQACNLNSIDLSMLVNLKDLTCDENNLNALNLDNNLLLEHLDCSDNNLNELNLANNINLERLNCRNINLSELNLNTNVSLQLVICQENNLIELDLSNNINLIYVSGSGNQLEYVNVQNCIFLKELTLGSNQLNSLDISNNVNLENLGLSNNQVIEIDLNNNINLNRIYLNNNQLTSLDVSNIANIERLWFFGNPLENLNIKNGSTTESNGYNNGYGINIPTLNYICVDQDEASQIQSLINSNNTAINTYCSFGPGGENFTLYGDNKSDINEDGCDNTDVSFPFLRLHFSDGVNNGFYYSNNTGTYNLLLSEGAHTITPILYNSEYFTVFPTSLEVSFPDDGETVNQDFCLTPNGVYNDLEIIVVPMGEAIPGFDAYYNLIYNNKGNTVLSGSINLNYEDDFMDFVASDIPVSSQNTGSLQWDFTNLVPFETGVINVTMNLNTPTDSEFPLNSDDILTFETEIISGSTDETPDDNVFEFNQVVVNSFDPNDKTCLEGNTLDIEKVGDYLHYRIRFENTGTTNATNIVVKDELDMTRFDVSSLTPIHASHDFVTKVSNGNLVEFIFENINLPFDDANNDGYIIYKVKTLPTLEVGDVIANDAEIYFDYNFPITTNNELTTVVEGGLSVSEYVLNNDITVYPNPAIDILHINSVQQLKSVKLFDMTGQLIKDIKTNSENQTTTIDINKLSTGLYFMEVQSGSKKTIHKVVKK